MQIVNFKNSKGFGLIELVLIILFLGLSAGALVNLFAQLPQTSSLNHHLQVATQLAQECGEYLLGLRRSFGFELGSVTDCSVIAPLDANGPPIVSIADPYTGSACPDINARCKQINVIAQYESAQANLSFMLVEY